MKNTPVADFDRKRKSSKKKFSDKKDKSKDKSKDKKDKSKDKKDKSKDKKDKSKDKSKDKQDKSKDKKRVSKTKTPFVYNDFLQTILRLAVEKYNLYPSIHSAYHSDNTEEIVRLLKKEISSRPEKVILQIFNDTTKKEKQMSSMYLSKPK